MTTCRLLKREEETVFFEQFEAVVFGVLKRMCITRMHSDYEDYAQIGRVSLVRAYETFPKNPWIEENRGAFVSYAFTRIRWSILDAIRREVRKGEREQVWDDTFVYALADPNGEFETSIVEKEWLSNICQNLSEAEKQLVTDLCLEHLSMTQIAKKEQVSRQTLYKRRKSIQEKLRSVL